MEMPPFHTFLQNALSHISAAAIKPLPPPARPSSHRVTLGQAAVHCRGQISPHVSLEVTSLSLASYRLCSAVSPVQLPKVRLSVTE